MLNHTEVSTKLEPCIFVADFSRKNRYSFMKPHQENSTKK